MVKFIDLTDIDGKEHLVQTQFITLVEEFKSGNTTCKTRLWVIADAGYKTKAIYLPQTLAEIKKIITS